ncbi:MAG TPA: hypothetical protein VGD58_27280 [Herpetosiphonaceae bacterium]
MDVFRNVVSLEHQAQAAYDAQLYQEASVLHSRAMVAAQHHDSRLVAALCLRLGETLSADQSMLDAVTVYEAGFQSCCAATALDVTRLLTSLQSVGPYFYRFDRMDQPCHDDPATAEVLQGTMDDPILPARLLIACAEEYERQSSLYLALYTYKRALDHLQAPTVTELRVDILSRLGALAYRQGELTTVDAALSELVELWLSTTNPHLLCHILAALGELYEAVGSVENALSVYREAVKISLSTSDAAAIGRARGRLVRLSTQQHAAQRGQRTTRQDQPRSVDLPLPAPREVPVETPLRQRVFAEPVYLDAARR